MLPHSDVFSSYARTYETRRDSEMSLAEYLEGCRDDPMMYASAPERILAAIGEPELVDTASDARLGRIFMNRTIRIVSGLLRILRHGRDDRADRQLLPPCRAGPGGAQADPLPARPRRRRQVVSGRAPEGADGGPSDLRAQGRRSRSARSSRARSACSTPNRWARCSRTATASRAAASPG